MRDLGIDESLWAGYFTREIARLHGWAGFIRWRASAKHYHWTQAHPGDLVDLLAIRLTLARQLIHQRTQHGMATCRSELAAMIESRLPETWLRYRFHTGAVAPDLAHAVDDTLARGHDAGADDAGNGAGGAERDGDRTEGDVAHAQASALAVTCSSLSASRSSYSSSLM